MRTGIVYDIIPEPVRMFRLPEYSEWKNMTNDEQNFAATVALCILPATLDIIRTWAEATFPEKPAAHYATWHELKHSSLGHPFDPELAAIIN